MDKSPRLGDLVRSTRPGESRAVYEFASPASLYLTGEQALAYLAATLTGPYQTRLVEPLGRLLEEHLPTQLHQGGAPTVMIDLGPGLPINSLPILKHLAGTGEKLWYVPVDISRVFLTITACFFEDAGFETIPVRALFEELPEHLSRNDQIPSSCRRVVNIGLTFNNFPLDTSCRILKSIFREGDRVLAASELIDPKKHLSSEGLLTPYRTKHAENFNFLSLQALGLNRSDLVYFARTFDQGIEMGFRVCREITIPGIGQAPPGTDLMTSVSYRYALDTLLAGLRKHFPCVHCCTEEHASVCLISMT